MTNSPNSPDAGSDDRRRSRHPELRGRVAVVTGGARGIGLGIARRLVTEGMMVALFDIDALSLDLARQELGQVGDGSVLSVRGDVGRAEDVDRLFETVDRELGPIGLLVNNAADLQRRGVLDEHATLLDTQLASNVVGPYLCSQRAAAVMARAGTGVTNGSGVIVNLSSVGGTRAHHDGLPYDVTKGAIDAMTRAMAVDLGHHGIRVNAVAPGVTLTHHTRNGPDSAAGRAMVARIPLRRFGTVDDIAAMVAFLASDDAAYVTGQVLVVDGGITTQLSPPGPHAF